MRLIVGPVPAGPDSLDSLAGEAAQRAAELRGAVGKGARPLKKKALGDFLRALQAAGASAFRTAVPADERSVSAWFMQVLHALQSVEVQLMRAVCLPGPCRCCACYQRSLPAWLMQLLLA